MFNFLKEKLKSWFKKTEEKAELAVAVGKIEEKAEEKLKIKEVKRETKAEKEEKPSFFKKIFGFKFNLDEDYFNEIFSDLELIMLENNVALQVVEKIKTDLKKELTGLEMKKEQVQEKIKEALKISLETILDIPQIDLIKIIKECKEEKRPCVLLFLGFNGTGKSLTLTKVAFYLKKKGYKPILAAGDTWRAAGIAQLEKYAQNINVSVIKHQQGSDSCAVIFDTIKAAKARNYNVVLADTAGRSHTDKNLMEELKKICRVNKPDLKILIVESLIGNDVINQVKMFDEAVNIDTIIFTKTDVDEKGGALLSASYITKKPILFLGSGQKPTDLEIFKPKKIIDSLEL